MASHTDFSQIAELPASSPYLPEEPPNSRQSLLQSRQSLPRSNQSLHQSQQSHHSSLEDALEGDEELRLVIGIDFGTTYTGMQDAMF
jgi:hypothetical protein